MSDAAQPTTTPSFLPIIAAAVIPLAVEVGTTALKNAAQTAQTDLTASYVAYGTAALTPNPTCIVVANGKFGTKNPVPIASKGKLSQIELDTIGAVEQPTIYIEIKITTDQKQGTRVFRPVFVQYNDTVAKNPGNGVKSVGLMLAFSTAPLDAKPGAAQADISKSSQVVIPFAFGKLARGTWMESRSDSVPKPTDVFFDQIRVAPFKTTDGSSIKATLDCYGFITESSDPTLFDKLFLDSVSDKTVTDNFTKIVASFFPANAAASGAVAK